jgi:pilus assembly protein Flp/PilA
MKFIKKLVRNDKGATAIEYGLIAAGISVVIIGAVQAIGTSVQGAFQTIATALR